VYDKDYVDYFAEFQQAGWPAASWCGHYCDGEGQVCGYGEEFWNCADIAVVGDGFEPPITVAPMPSPPITVAPTPGTPDQEPEAEMEEEEEEEEEDGAEPVDCAIAWGKCGGVAWDGATCCIAGYSCQFQSEWYSQCVPEGSAPVVPVAPVAPAPTVPAPNPANGGCSPLWGQCGGEGWAGPLCCEAGAICDPMNQWYHQCVLETGAAMASVDEHLQASALRGRRIGKHHTMAMVEVDKVVSKVDTWVDESSLVAYEAHTEL